MIHKTDTSDEPTLLSRNGFLDRMGEVKEVYRIKPGDTVDCYDTARFIADMKKQQNGKIPCWEMKNCQRCHGGEKEAEFGMCITYPWGGWHCWALAGTLCGGMVQGSSAQKEGNCQMCQHYIELMQDDPAKLKADSAYFSAVMQSVLAGIATVNAKGIIDFQSSQRFQEFFGADIAGKHLSVALCLSGEDSLKLKEWTSDVFRLYGKNSWDMLMNMFPLKDSDIQVGGRHFRISVSPFLRRDDTTGQEVLHRLLVQASDVSLEVRALEKVNRKLMHHITELNKVERMKSEFISTVSHELRTPLTSIRGSLGLLMGGVGGGLPTQARALVDIAHKNSERLILLVNDILDMEKIESGKMEFDMQPAKLMPLLEQALEGNHAYGEQFKVSFEIERVLPEAMVRVDSNRLMQVFANLLSNAAKFSPAGGKVSVAVTRADERIRVEVKDRGLGIPDEFKERIFQKFAQADSSDTRKKGGTGLGLSITKAMVEQMGGSIGFDSQPNILTVFFIEFPVWRDAVVFGPDLEIHDLKKLEHRKRVLICEDDHDIAALLRLMLEQAGLATDIAYNAAQAKQLLVRGGYAAMTLDVGLPDQDGIALIRELRTNAATATLPIVVVSAKATEGRKELNGEAFNVIDWISKPINQDHMILAIKQAVSQFSDTRPRVLHVEDDTDIFRVINGILGEIVYLENAVSLADARLMLESNSYDLVILDVSLPDGSGMELLPMLNGAMPPIPVMVFSASEMTQEDVREVKSVLVKSRTDNVQLLATIKRLIGIE